MIALELDTTAVEPGSLITGRVTWTGRPVPFDLTLRWQTRGKGDTDTATVVTAVVRPGEAGATEVRFELTAPEQPFTFSGSLISLGYYVRVEGAGLGSAEREVIIAPGGAEVRLAGA